MASAGAEKGRLQIFCHAPLNDPAGKLEAGEVNTFTP